jgi:hypothetical protein
MAKQDRNTVPATANPAPLDSTDLAVVESESAAIVHLKGPEDAARAFAGYELAPVFIRLEEGDMVAGQFVREGAVASSEEETDPVTGEIRRKSLPTVILRTSYGLVEFLSAHELRRSLAGVREGTDVRILRGREVSRGKNRVTEYRVGFRMGAGR